MGRSTEKVEPWKTLSNSATDSVQIPLPNLLEQPLVISKHMASYDARRLHQAWNIYSYSVVEWFLDTSTKSQFLVAIVDVYNVWENMGHGGLEYVGSAVFVIDLFSSSPFSAPRCRVSLNKSFDFFVQNLATEITVNDELHITLKRRNLELLGKILFDVNWRF